MLVNYWKEKEERERREKEDLWRKKTWENVQCILLSKLYPDSSVLLFHFHQF